MSTITNLTAAQATILAAVRRDGPTVFDARKAKAIHTLEALGLVTVVEKHWYLTRKGYGGKSYLVTEVKENES